jgi:hypothetical protein
VTQKLYVRRTTRKPAPDGGGEVFDATIEVPVTIRNPEKRIGTHVFTAVARNDTGLRWTAVTIDHGDDARNAPDRITIPQDVLDRIAPTALPRSSIIVSDEPVSRETNYRTEFIAVLSNQPQGGFITRPRTPDVLVAGGNDWGAETPSRCRDLFRTEIDIGLHSDRELSRSRQSDCDPNDIHVGLIARSGRLEAARLDQRRDRRDVSLELAIGKRGRSHGNYLPDFDRPEVAFVQFRAHA